MSTFDKFPTPKVESTRKPKGPQSPEEAMSWHPEPVAQESPEVCAEKIAELEALFKNFESKYDLDDLHAITRFVTKEERHASIRTLALADIPPMLKLVNWLEGQNAVSREAHEHLQRRYRILNGTVIGTLRDSPDGIGEIVVHRKVNDDGTIDP
jgi:hypothetical protein